MQYIVKLFPEIIIKSKPVRKKFTRQLRDNLRKLLSAIDPEVIVTRDWDRITVETALTDAGQLEEMAAMLSQTPGVAHFLEVQEFPLGDFEDVFQRCRTALGNSLKDKRFVVRCKRSGQHDFSSTDIERYVGGGLLQHCDTGGVDLHNPEVTVRLEVRKDQLYIVGRRIEGLGGFPLGSVDAVMSLISGGFDSTVSSYMTMKRGLRTHFCFFNLGGREHEVGVKEVALYLWQKFGASHRVKFVSVPFEDVVGEILKNVENSQMGVVLKRMMLRAASNMAAQLEVSALVTGESVAQVSSQTLTNLTVIDRVTDTLVLRPLITSDKQDIISLARQIGTEEFAANMPEYCGVISVKPTTRARPDKIAQQEEAFDFEVLNQAIARARFINIDELADEDLSVTEVEVLPVPLPDALIIDVRHPDEVERRPLRLSGCDVQHIPFYELHRRAEAMNRDASYQLYCDRGAMSRLHAAHLIEQGFSNVKVYRPR